MRISAEKEAVLSSTTVIVITNSSLSRFLLGAKNLLTLIGGQLGRWMGYHTLSSLRDCYRTSKRNADAYRIAKPEISTTWTDGRVPLVELLKGDTELAVDLVAGIAALNCVVLVAVGCCAGLGRCRWTTSAASGSTRGSANAVRIAIWMSVKRDGSILWEMISLILAISSHSSIWL